MPTEGTLFKDVDFLWKSTMEGIVSENGIMDLADKDNIK